ncbi:ornithine transcarbamylase, mitochondrial isoform X2 [Octopus bimaculoides]|uniref:ornithine transcarbamylase, mitochondrial isoform X2 n=1 Tax=Octopus bimaculoides TaxID=37653 RepID=UPI00071E6580|nr:ornithine transcarbamylase, mitochondrial isoform X2 [Octopus bimaculoides]|eukprot:XP_014784366.1 PREDICTED: ornithine carbamoyltransferase, mitochondrial-like isoform X2 [Octopus bimaculoides]
MYSEPLIKALTSSLVGRDFDSLKYYQPDEIRQLLWTANDLKVRIKKDKELYQPLVGKSLAMIFQKRSTRTRVSSETGMNLLGGQSVFLGPEDVHIGVNESIKDTARVLCQMCDVILARVYGHDVVDTLASESSVPVINGLSDLFHPLQILADLLTLQEHFGGLRDLKLAWVGDGNNIIHSLMIACAKLGIEICIATPLGYLPDSNIIASCNKFSAKHGGKIHLTNDPKEAVYRANAIITDTWISMGQEEESAKRLKDFDGYEVNSKLVKEAAADWVFMHCLPRHKEEVSDSVFYGKNSVVWQEAENRKWTVMAVIHHLLKDYQPVHPQPDF